jgi:anthranilate phosphoribosyltransferase
VFGDLCACYCYDHVVSTRKELAVRTIFNVLGPLTNPAKAPRQVMGVYDKALVEPIANVLKSLGSKHVMVVHSKDGYIFCCTIFTVQCFLNKHQ